MQQILVYSDSLSWGIVPTTRKRLSVAPASAVDGIHLDADQHHTLGRALARCVAALPGVLSPATS